MRSERPRPSATRLIVKLTTGIRNTHKRINTARVTAKTSSIEVASGTSDGCGRGGGKNDGWVDENGHCIVKLAEIISGRYMMAKWLGRGSFGQVIMAEDMQAQTTVAVKMFMSTTGYLEAARREIDVLTQLLQKDPRDQHHLVRMRGHFIHRNHQCIVFEMLPVSLRQAIVCNKFIMSLTLVRHITKQVLRALAFLSRPDVDIVHADLTPQNIMFRDLRTATIKVIDFGLSGWTGQKRLTYVQSLPYRSPEVMLRLPYGVPIDMWSLGCIMVEMHTRVPLFVGTDELNQMQKIVEILGAIPDIMLEASNEQIRSHFFARSISSSGSPTWSVRQPTVLQSSVTKSLLDAVDPTASPTASFGEESDQIVHNPDPKASLAKLITARSSEKIPTSDVDVRNSTQTYENFVDLVFRMLAYKPEDRIKPREALLHPFITARDATVGSAEQAHLAAQNQSGGT